MKKKKVDDPTVGIAKHKCEYFYAMQDYKTALIHGLSIINDPLLTLPKGGPVTLAIQDLVARCYLKVKDYTNALPLLLIINETNRRDCELMRVLGECYRNLGERGEAQAWFLKAVLLSDTNVRNWLSLGEFLLSNDKDSTEWELGRLCFVQARHMVHTAISRAKGNNSGDKPNVGISANETLFQYITTNIPNPSAEHNSYTIHVSVDKLRERLFLEGEGEQSVDFDTESPKDQGNNKDKILTQEQRDGPVTILYFLSKTFKYKPDSDKESDVEAEEVDDDPMNM